MQHGAHPLGSELSKTGRATVPGARGLARADEHLFPTLRLVPVAGETSLENILRQIDALMQAPQTPALPPPERPPPREAKQRAPPVPPPTEPAPQRGKARRRNFAYAEVGAGLAASLILACVTLYPTNAHFLASWIAQPHPVEAAVDTPAPPPATAAPALAGMSSRGAPPVPAQEPRAVSGVSIVAMPPLQAPAAAAPQAEARAAPPPATAGDLTLEAALGKSGATLSPPTMSSASPPLAAAPPPAAQPDPAAPAPAVASDHPAAPEAEQRASTVDIPVGLLLERGNRLLASGDIASARQFFQRAHAAGVAAAARRIAVTYDPLFLRQIGAVGVRADAARAAEWYRRAANAGDVEAADRLDRLEGANGGPRSDDRETPSAP